MPYRLAPIPDLRKRMVPSTSPDQVRTMQKGILMSRTIDFRTTYWGHNIHLMQKGDQFRGSCHSTPRPMKGDTLLWRTEYGHAVAEVTAVDYCRDPDDMCFIECRVIDRIMHKVITNVATIETEDE